MHIDDFAETGPSLYLNQETIVVEDTMYEMPRLTTSFLVYVVRPLVGKNFDRMFELSAVAFFLDAVKDVVKRDFPDDQPPKSDEIWISMILLSIVRHLVGKKFDPMFELYAVAFFLDAVRDVARWDFYISEISLSDCMHRDFVRDTMDFMKIPPNNENRLEYERLVEALEQ